MSNPKELTEEEVRAKVLEHVWELIQYWEKESSRTDSKGKLQGLAFSMLSMLDGDSMGIPKFIVAPDPHPKDKAYHKKEGEDWFPDNSKVNIKADLGGSLHEHFHDAGRKLGYLKDV